MARISFPIGYQRIPASTRPSQASYTRAIRSQMEQIIKNAQAVIAAIEGDSIDALKYALEPIYDESQILVPVDTGRLKASGFIEARKTGRGVTGAVGYGKGGDPYYAVYVHEHLELRHEAPTQAKFLEEAVNRHIDEIPERYAEYIRNSTGLG